MIRHIAAALATALLLAPTACMDPDDWILEELEAQGHPIIGGEVDEDDLFLPVVAIYFHVSMWEGGLCTGTIVNDEWILTAAHCPVDGYNLGASRVYIGHDMYAGDVTKLPFDQVEIHPDYNSDMGVPMNDVAVIHLEEPSPIEGIPINRETLGDDHVGEDFTYVGFGLSEPGMEQVDGLKRFVDIEVADVYPFGFDVLYYSDPSAGTDHGDSGGPALYDFGDGPRVAGVTSWGGGDYGVSMAVDAMADWIDEQTGGDSEPWTDDDDAGDDDDSAADDDADDDSADDDDDGGNGCQCTTTSPAAAGLLAPLALLALLARRRIAG